MSLSRLECSYSDDDGSITVFTHFFKKPSSRPITKSFVMFGHILVLEVFEKFLNLGNKIAVKAYAERECSKLFVL